MKKQKILNVVCFLILCVTLVIVIRVNKSRTYQKPYVFFAMDTFFEITIEDKQFDKDIFNKIENKVYQIDQLLNAYNPTSEVAKINKNAGITPVKVSPEVIRFLSTTDSYFRKTNGLFDVTFQPIQDLYGFSSGQYHVPSQEEIKKSKMLVNNKKLIIHPINKTAFLEEKNMVVNLSAVLKGYVLDEVKQVIELNHIKRYHLNFGGNLYIHSNQKEKIGIKHPRAESIIKTFWVQDGFVSTSADYQQYFEKDGLRYSHIVNPITGSAHSELKSVTVVGDSGMETDFLSTYLYLSNPRSIQKYVETYFPNIQYFTFDGIKEELYHLEPHI